MADEVKKAGSEDRKVGNPNWHKGMPSANPKGRPKGSRNKITQRELDRIYAEGSTISEYLFQVMHDDGESTADRLKAAIKLLDYGNTPVSEAVDETDAITITFN